MRNAYYILVTGLTLALSGNVAAQEMQVSVDGAIDAYSQYICRGFNLADKVSIQPSLTLGFGESGVAFDIWGSAAMQDRGSPTDLDQADELDFTLSLDRTLSEEASVGLSLGYIQYTFPSLEIGTKHSEEVCGGISLDNAAAPSLTAYYDFGLANAWYISFGIGPEFPLDSEGKASLGFGASVGLSDATRDFGFNDATLTTSIGFSQGMWTISPTFGYSYSDDGVNKENSEVWGGVSIGFSK